MIEPFPYQRDSWSRSFLASSKALFRAEASDIGFDGVELADEPHTLFCNRGSAGACGLNQLATGMCPAIGELSTRADVARRDQPIVAGIAIHLQNAAKALQDPFGMKAPRPGA